MTHDRSSVDLDTLERELIELISTSLLVTGPEFGVESSLADAGLDSMAVVQLLLLLETRYGVWMPEEDLTPDNFASVRSLAQALRTRLDER
jgi:acyl carrier protein